MSSEGATLLRVVESMLTHGWVPSWGGKQLVRDRQEWTITWTKGAADEAANV